MKKRTAILVIGLLVYGVVLGLVLTSVVSYNSSQTKKELEEVFDEVDQDMAIKQLSELRGMILEVEALSHEYIPQGVLLDELESITSSLFIGKIFVTLSLSSLYKTSSFELNSFSNKSNCFIISLVIFLSLK